MDRPLVIHILRGQVRSSANMRIALHSVIMLYELIDAGLNIS